MIRFEDLLDRVRGYNPDADLELLRRAYVFSALEHKGQVRHSGEPYLVHPLEVADILAGMKLDAVCVAAGVLLDGGTDFRDAALTESGTTASAVGAVLGWLASINLLVLLFNLIPAFPLDGGRIARAIAWWRTGDRTRATRFAATLGQGFGLLMIVSVIAHLSFNFRGLLNHMKTRSVAWVGGVLVVLMVLLYGVVINNKVPDDLARQMDEVEVGEVLEDISQPARSAMGRTFGRVARTVQGFRGATETARVLVAAGVGMATGATLMCLFDPTRGRDRRARVSSAAAFTCAALRAMPGSRT